MPRTVLLQHTLPDGAWHYDWLIARDGDAKGVGAGPVITFRVDTRVDTAAPGSDAVLVRMPDHRPLYLTYEGSVSGGRGRVERVAEGVCRVLIEGSDRVEFEADLGHGPRFWTCIQNHDDDNPSVRRWKAGAT